MGPPDQVTTPPAKSVGPKREVLMGLFHWRDDDGALVEFSGGWLFLLRVGNRVSERSGSKYCLTESHTDDMLRWVMDMEFSTAEKSNGCFIAGEVVAAWA